jgi:hypothetical protein
MEVEGRVFGKRKGGSRRQRLVRKYNGGEVNKQRTLYMCMKTSQCNYVQLIYSNFKKDKEQKKEKNDTIRKNNDNQNKI